MSSPGKNNAPPVLYIRTCKKIKKHDSLLSKYLCLASNPGAGFLSKCKDHLHSLGKMSLFTAFSGKGSITVETAAVLPLFLLFFLSLSVFFQTLHVQSRADLSLMQSSREMAVLQYGAETGGTDQPGAAAAVGTVYAQGKLLLDCPPVYQKQKGIVLAGVGMPVTRQQSGQADLSAEQALIALQTRFRVRPWFSLTRGHLIQGCAAGTARAWIGGGGVSGEGRLSGDVVYKTEHGTVYHTDPNCTYLQPSVSVCPEKELGARRNTDGELYRGCELCGAAQNSGGNVFITRTGNRYHTDLGCSALKRMIYTVPREEAEGAFCSKCAGHDG